MTVLVTGATGKVGGQAVTLLRDGGVPVRALVRDPASARLPDGVEVARGDLGEPGGLADALSGVDSVFLVFPTLQADDAADELITTLAKQVRHVVYLSAIGADENAEGILGSHGRLESLIKDSGTSWTFLRPGGFAANTLGWAEQIRAGDVVRWFHGAAGRAPIHERDIASVGVRALTEDGHLGVTYRLTGPEQLTQAEQVHIIGEAIGRPLRFAELDPETAKQELFPGMPPEFASSIVDGHGHMVTHPEEVTRTVEQVTGRPALTFRRWAEDHAADFTRTPPAP